MNRTGGLLWHWRAWQRQPQWQGACDDIGQWLGQVQPVSQELLIIGASAVTAARIGALGASTP